MRSEAKSGAERQKAHRAKRHSVSIDVSGDTAQLLRALRTKVTTDALIMRALQALGASLAAEAAEKRATAAPRSLPKSRTKTS
jgi:hypothetical protein